MIIHSDQKTAEIAESEVHGNSTPQLQLLLPQNPHEKIKLKLPRSIVRLIFISYKDYLRYIQSTKPELKSYQLQIKNKIEFFRHLLENEK